MDFVIIEEGKAVAVYQSSYSVKDARTKNRETNALVRALAAFNLKEGTIVTENEETIKGFHIRYLPAWKLLLR